jgi:hypothetical protein
MNPLCQLCEKRRARRHCPGIKGDICPQCCGTARENTVDCPIDCEHLQEARRHEVTVEPATSPNADIRVSEDFIRENEHVVMWLSNSLARAIEAGAAVDNDVREALEAQIKTYRTRESGLIYQTRPQNPYAAQLQDEMEKAVEELRKRAAEDSGMQSLRDKDVLGTLVFLQRLELRHNNGRRRGRAFYDMLRHWFPASPPAGAEQLGLQP